MGKFIHLDPEERKQIVENIIEQFGKQLDKAVARSVGNFAITEQDVAIRVDAFARYAVEEHIKKRLRFPWLYRLLFK